MRAGDSIAEDLGTRGPAFHTVEAEARDAQGEREALRNVNTGARN
jgi:hypothetical protein